MTKDQLHELMCNVEMHMSIECYHASVNARKQGKDYKCTCEDPFKWSEEKLKEYADKHGIDYNE